MTTATLAPPPDRTPAVAEPPASRSETTAAPLEARLQPQPAANPGNAGLGAHEPLQTDQPDQPARHAQRARLALTRRVRHLARGLRSLAFLTVVLPTLLAALYFGAWASGVYVSESTFVVRSSERPSAGGLMGALLPGSAFSGPQDDARLVHSFMRSRDALAELEKRLQLRAKFSDTAVDRLSRFPTLDLDDSDEGFYRYWRDQVSAEPDASSSLSVLRVNAFDARTAQQVNAELLDMAEALVNRLNERIRADAIRLASAEVTRAEQQVVAVAQDLARYRTRNEVYDPDRQSALQLTANSKLQDELMVARAQLSELRLVSPDNPRVAPMQARVRDLEREVAQGQARITGSQRSLAQQVVGIQQLQVRQATADRQLAAALAALEQARNDARRQQLYLERIAQPNLPDVAAFPRPVRAVFTTLLLGLLAWGLLVLVRAAVNEHRD